MYKKLFFISSMIIVNTIISMEITPFNTIMEKFNSNQINQLSYNDKSRILHHLAVENNLAKFKQLYNYNDENNKRDEELFCIYRNCPTSNEKRLEQYKGYKPDPDYRSYILNLEQAWIQENLGIIQALVINNTTDCNKRTLLHNLPWRHSADISGVKTIDYQPFLEKYTFAVEHSTDLNTVDNDGNSPLHHAIWYVMRNKNIGIDSTTSIIDLLVNKGAHVNIANNNGYTALDLIDQNELHDLWQYIKPEDQSRYNKKKIITKAAYIATVAGFIIVKQLIPYYLSIK